MLIMTISNVNINLSTENYQGISELHTQTEAIQLARIMEFDVRKAGYHVPSVDATTGEKIAIADSAHVKFYTDMDNSGSVIPIEYALMGFNNQSKNPLDKMLIRVENINTVYINYSVIRFRLSYYNTHDSLMTTPVTGALRDSIRSIKLLLMLQNSDPFDTTTSSAPSYATAMYQKLIFPRNLSY